MLLDCFLKHLYFQVKESDVNEDDPVDILSVEKDSAFSDSDASQDELCFLPAVPCPEAPEQQEKYFGSSSKIPDGNQSESPLSVEAGQNGHAANNASSPPEGIHTTQRSLGFYLYD